MVTIPQDIEAKIDAFVSKYDQQFIIRNVNLGAQCAAEANQFLEEVFGYQGISPIAAPTAYMMWLNLTHPDFIKLETNDISQFIKGDLIIFGPTINPDPKMPYGGAGHIDTFLRAIGEGFEAFDQNYPVGSPCHIQWHANNRHIVGAIRQKTLLNKPKKHMKIFDKIEQVVYTREKNPDGTHGKVLEYWVIWIKNDGSKTKRLVMDKPALRSVLIMACVDEGQCLYDWTDVSHIDTMERGSDFDFSDFMDNHIELFVKE